MLHRSQTKKDFPMNIESMSLFTLKSETFNKLK